MSYPRSLPGRGYAWFQVPSWGGWVRPGQGVGMSWGQVYQRIGMGMYNLPDMGYPLVLTPSGGHHNTIRLASGHCASYWNVFLFE